VKKEDANKALWDYYKILSEQCIHVGTQLHQSLSLSITCMMLFLTFTGLLITQKVNFSFNLVTIGIAIIDFVIFLFFISSVGYYLHLRIHLHNIFGTVMKMEELQRDILFDKVSEDELEMRFEGVYPFLNASRYKTKWKILFRRW